MIINEKYRVELNNAGGFNLFVRSQGINEKTGKTKTSEQSYFYPKLEMIASRMLENEYPAEALSIKEVEQSLKQSAKEIGEKLDKLIKRQLNKGNKR